MIGTDTFIEKDSFLVQHSATAQGERVPVQDRNNIAICESFSTVDDMRLNLHGGAAKASSQPSRATPRGLLMRRNSVPSSSSRPPCIPNTVDCLDSLGVLAGVKSAATRTWESSVKLRASV